MNTETTIGTTCPACAAKIPPHATDCPKCGAGSPRVSVQEPVKLPPLSKGSAALGVLCLLAALVYPALQAPDGPRRRPRCVQNLKTIGLALRAYHDQYGSLPPAYVADKEGRPMHSWRVLLLPFLDEQELYDEYDFSEPWDGPHNVALLEELPEVYACPAHLNGKGWNTSYLALVGEGCAFRGGEAVRLQQFPDGLENTLLVAEAAYANVPWTRPEDLHLSDSPQIGDHFGFSSDHPVGVHFLMADGAVRCLPETVAGKQ